MGTVMSNEAVALLSLGSEDAPMLMKQYQFGAVDGQIQRKPLYHGTINNNKMSSCIQN
jgi:hypothetical protein